MRGIARRMGMVIIVAAAAAASWSMAPAFGPGALLPLLVPPVAWAAVRSARHRATGGTVWILHFALLAASLLLSLLPLPVPVALWGALLWVVLPLAVLGRAAGGASGLLHGLLWILVVWSVWGVLVASRGDPG